MRSLVKNATKGLVGIIDTAIITALITGQPLAGLTKLRGLYQTFISSAVPAWAFACAFLTAVVGIYYAFAHLPKRRTMPLDTPAKIRK